MSSVDAGWLLGAVPHTVDPEFRDNFARAVSSAETATFAVERPERKSVVDIYRRRLVAIDQGRGPATDRMAEFVAALEAASGEWISWVTIKDSVNTLWIALLSDDTQSVVELVAVHDRPLRGSTAGEAI